MFILLLNGEKGEGRFGRTRIGWRTSRLSRGRLARHRDLRRHRAGGSRHLSLLRRCPRVCSGGCWGRGGRQRLAGRPGRRSRCSGWGISVPRIDGPGAKLEGEAKRCCKRSLAFGDLVELVKLLLGCVFQREPQLLRKLLGKGRHCLGFLRLFCSCCFPSLPSGKEGFLIVCVVS